MRAIALEFGPQMDPRPSSIADRLRAELFEGMTADRARLAPRIERLERRGVGAAEIERVAAAVAASRERAAARAAAVPRIIYPPELPVSERRGEIAAAIRDHQVVIVCGETGSGKTTQLPKICLELQRGVRGLIGHTQPRRIAARSVAARIAQELAVALGTAVGFKVRFTDRTGPDAYIKLMTDGILLAETQRDRLLAAYDTIIVDEAHERSLNIDFLLGYLKQLLPRRPDLKVIVTSATLDAERFARHFSARGRSAPVIQVSGRTYPVEMRYRPLAGDEDDDEEPLEEAIVAAVEDLWRAAAGDILVFLPGEREIRETADLLRSSLTRRPYAAAVEILPLYARLSVAEQQRVFAPSRGRRLVLATNVAETSLTVPGIHYIVDPGLARIKRYSLRNKTTLLQIEKVSQAAANQRAGRCGRVAAGVCVRLYGEEDFAARPRYTDPEILRSSLAAVILRMAALDLGEVAAFPFLEPPGTRAIADGFQLLAELSAVDGSRKLTALGRELAQLPVDPRIGRMILAGREHGCLAEALVIASALAVPDPRERPLEKQQAADQAHLRFRDERSDFLSLIALWQFFADAQAEGLSHRRLVERCRAHFVSYLRLIEWRDLYRQLADQVRELGWRFVETLPDKIDDVRYATIHRALLAGLLSNIGSKAEDAPVREQQYLGARGIRFLLHSGSGLAKKGPKWVLAAELTETTRLYARCAAKIEPEWVEAVAGDLVGKTHFDPRWDKERGEVVANERVTLFGLTLVPRRRVSYGAIAPAAARETFIREALVAGDFETKAAFFAHNRRLVAEVAELEHKARRQDVLVDAARLSWLVPGMIREKVTWYLKALPKAWRNRLSPLPEVVTAFLEEHPAAKVALPDALRAFVAKRLGDPLPPGTWDADELPPHLRINVRVVDAAGRELAAGRDLAALRTQLGEAAQLSFAAAEPAFERRGIRSWDFGDLPEALSVQREGRRLTGYPALVDERDGVALKLLDTRAAADAATRDAVIALMRLQLKDALRQWEKGGPGFVQAALILKPALPTENLLADMLAAVRDRAFLGDDPLPRSERAFTDQVKRARARLPAVAEGAFRLLSAIAAEYHGLSQRIAALPKSLRPFAADIAAQRDRLVAPGFFAATPWNQLVHIPRYLRALDRRVVKYPENPARDAKHARALAALWERYREREQAARMSGGKEAALDAFRWLIEELKVSLFAQELRTPIPVSYKRLEKAWKELSSS